MGLPAARTATSLFLPAGMGQLLSAGSSKAFTPAGERSYLQSLLPKTPDLTDEAVQAAVRASRLQTGMNRRSTFITSSKPSY